MTNLLKPSDQVPGVEPTRIVSDLDERIAAAFGDRAQSDDVKTVILEVEAAAITSGKVAKKAHVRALDPTLALEHVADARKEMQDAEFRRERLGNAVKRLRDRLKELLADEDDQRRLVVYKRVKATRDELAAELKATYPVIEAQLRDLLTRLAASDREVERINATGLPRRGGRLLSAELVARGLPGFVINTSPLITSNVPRITQDLCLPTFKYSHFEPYAWPGQR
jgi:hypothetical protein